MNRHFKVQTSAGIEDIYCNDMDDTKEGEVWFIVSDLPPRIFNKKAIISVQEIPVPTEKQQEEMRRKWNERAERNDPPDDYTSDELP